MRYAVCTIAYNEGEYIKACIANWKDVVEKHLVLVSVKPWNGSAVEDDGTYSKAKAAGAEVVLGEWKTEGEQRTWGLARLYDYDYVFIVDADEFYTKEDQRKMIDLLDNMTFEHQLQKNYSTREKIPVFCCGEIRTYWKTPEYRFEPKDGKRPVIIAEPKLLYGHDNREFKFLNGNFVRYAPMLDEITCHHMSWAKSNAKVSEKIQSFSHASGITPGWYENVWSKWEPGSMMKVRAYGHEPSIAIHDPAPQEIIDLIEKHK